MTRFLLALFALSLALLSGCAGIKTPEDPRPLVRKPRIAIALGGGAARGFAHIGVLKALESQGIMPDIIVGTSAGSVVGALYAAGITPYDMQKLALKLDEGTVTDWSLFDRGWVKGESLERYINQQVGNKPMEGLRRKFAAVATDLQTGQMTVFELGNTGQAVRASAAIPGVFSPVTLRGREYVDGGLVSPVPVNAARKLGADLVIAVDISDRPSGRRGQGTLDVLLDTISIMGNAIARTELTGADVIIRPDVRNLAATSFDSRNEAIMEGEKAAFAAVPLIRQRLTALGARQ
ncbi:MAG: patatin-like phospholipase family protein [Rhodocyclaceae bacterium]|nr:patatin-like phospholipase family protein [Rhodocyclaceae bacterium]